jgi:hypothetical protein
MVIVVVVVIVVIDIRIVWCMSCYNKRPSSGVSTTFGNTTAR